MVITQDKLRRHAREDHTTRLVMEPADQHVVIGRSLVPVDQNRNLGQDGRASLLELLLEILVNLGEVV